MTHNEYRNKVFGQIKTSNTRLEVIDVIENAQKVLDDSNTSESSQKQFWVELYEQLGGDDFVLLEKQAGSSLSDIVAAAKSVIAQKAKK
ncbi:hypothetical protein KA005_29090 [bacterium]|nr:hypothetical protein [bacterium]